jgi:RNA polymerase sigma factor (sigma-70 family)
MIENTQTTASQTAPEATRVGVWDVFLSYAMEDAAWVKVLVDHLQTRQLKVFDPYAAPTEFWGRSREEILNTILPAKCRAVLVVLSTAYSNSAFGDSELSSFTEAVETQSAAILLPVRLDESPVPDAVRLYATLDIRGISPDAVADTISVKLQENCKTSKAVTKENTDEALSSQKQVIVDEIVQYRERMLIYVRRMGLPMDVAEDIVEEAIVRILTRSQHLLINRGTLERYFFVVARNVAYDYLRKTHRQRREIQTPTLFANIEKLPSIDQDMIDEVRHAIDKLPTRDKTMIQMFYVDGLTTSEVAKQLNITPNYTSQILQRIRHKLRHLIRLDEVADAKQVK